MLRPSAKPASFILSWLNNIPSPFPDAAPATDTTAKASPRRNHQATGLGKRKCRPAAAPDNATTNTNLPSPPSSTSAMSTTPKAKRPKHDRNDHNNDNDDDDDDNNHNDNDGQNHTPRQRDYAQQRDDAFGQSTTSMRPPPPTPPPPVFRTSSAASTSCASVANTSAATDTTASSLKRRREELSLIDNGVVWADLAPYNAPDVLQPFLDRIVDVVDGREPFLPSSERARIESIAGTVGTVFGSARQFRTAFAPPPPSSPSSPSPSADHDNDDHDDDEEEDPYAYLQTAPGRVPSPEEVCLVMHRAKISADREADEAIWNAEVHLPLLHAIFRHPDEYLPASASTPPPLLDVTLCTAAKPTRQFLPTRDTAAKMVDMAIYIRPDTTSDPRLEPAMKRFRGSNKTTINHTNHAFLRAHPIGVSIETKKPGANLTTAEYQLGVWLSAQYKFLATCYPAGPGLGGTGDTATTGSTFPGGCPETDNLLPPFIPALIIIGHEWKLVFATHERGGKTTIWGNYRIGTTASAGDVYKIAFAVRELGRWSLDVYWPWFRRQMLGLPLPPSTT